MIRKCLPRLTVDEFLLLTGAHPENDGAEYNCSDICTDVSGDDVINKLFDPCTDEEVHEGADFVHS